ncbi:MAG: hypothetical protein AAF409_04945 [Pseudomonadota bacterium]
MKTPEREIFFVGFLSEIPPGLRRFLALTCVILPCVFAGLGFAVSATQDDPGDGAFRFDLGRQELTGVVTALPYPTLTIIEGSELLPPGHVLMLSGAGKTGARAAAGLDGQLARIQGIALTRGTLTMLQLAGGARAPAPVEGAVLPAPTPDTSLGRWRLTGEICDGKCLAGAMRPGTGLSHKACANLCLIGGIPPVFAATGDVEGEAFFLIAGPDGGPMPEHLLEITAVLIEAEGEIVRRGDLLIFKLDPATARVL